MVKQISQIITHDGGSQNIGGKAQRLFELRSLGYCVPHFVVVPAASVHADTHWQALAQSVCTHFSDCTSFSVRSSAAMEDGKAFAFAGLFKTFLHVPVHELAQRMAEVWHSSEAPQVRAYLKAHGLEHHPEEAFRPGIIVQEMVSADVAGVAFGVHPVTADAQVQVISAVYGLGEGLVSGRLNADHYTLSGRGKVEMELAQKTERVVFDLLAQTGVVTQTVPTELQDQPCLTYAQLLDIQAVLAKLKLHYGHPQDIEFAIADGQLFLLQTRPVTAACVTAQPCLETEQPSAQSQMTLWDNSNIVESYPGLTSPLTFSFIRKMYEAVYIQLSGLLGVSQQRIDAEKDVFAQMLGLINGRVYYNLFSWYRALAMLPGYALNADFMERMMGVKERFNLPAQPPSGAWSERWRVVGMIYSILKNLITLPTMRRRFTREFQQVMNTYAALDFSSKDEWELMRLYQTYETTLLKKWKAPLVNDFFAMIYFGVLQKLVVKYQLDAQGTLQNQLLCGSHDIISTDPIRRCTALAQLIGEHDLYRWLFEQTSECKLAELYAKGDLPQAIQEQVAAYLELWGHRVVGELKLETITYRQDPMRFFAIIKSYVRQGVGLATSSPNLELQLRAEGEAQVKKALAGKPFKRWIFGYVLRKTRELVSARENLRYERTRAFGTVREIFLALGARFKRLQIIENQRDIFYLTQEEIFAFIQGTSVHPNLKALVHARKTQEMEYRQSAKPAERIKTFGAVYTNALHQEKGKMQQEQGDTLFGLACCPGVVQGRVRVVHDPLEIEHLNGDILVTLSTDPGWVTLFPTASAILVEKGSLLSHSAITSREMAKPCIVGVTGLLDWLCTGDLIEMDGSTGRITKLQP